MSKILDVLGKKAFPGSCSSLEPPEPKPEGEETESPQPELETDAAPPVGDPLPDKPEPEEDAAKPPPEEIAPPTTDEQRRLTAALEEVYQVARESA